MRRLFDAGIEQYQLGRIDVAIERFGRALGVARRVGDLGIQGSLNAILASCYRDLGAVDRANEALAEAARILAELDAAGMDEDAAVLREQIEEAGGASLLLKKELERDGGLLVADHQLGLLLTEGIELYQTDALPDALDRFGRALDRARQVRDRRSEAVALTNLGTVYEEMGAWKQAVDHLTQAIAIQKEIGDRQGEAHSRQSMEKALLGLRRFDETLQQDRQATDLAHDHRGRSDPLLSLIEAYLSAASDPQETQRVIREHPELLDPSVDVALARMIDDARRTGDEETVNILIGRRQLLDECRRLGIRAALSRYEAYVLVRRFVEAPDPPSKLRVIEENPQILKDGDIALHQLIDAAQQAGNQEAVHLFEQHLWLLVTSQADGPRKAFAAAFGKRWQRGR
jgi:tetratricopeptide (TPR) repeat protein